MRLCAGVRGEGEGIARRGNEWTWCVCGGYARAGRCLPSDGQLRSPNKRGVTVRRGNEKAWCVCSGYARAGRPVPCDGQLRSSNDA